MTDTIQIGNLTVYQRQPLGSSQFGKTFHGVYQRRTDIVVLLVDKKEFHADIDILTKELNHSNIIQVFCIEKNKQFR